MSINLEKGQKIDLEKQATEAGVPSFVKIAAAAGWDVKAAKSTGADFDLDLSVMMLNNGKKMRSDEDLVYYGRKVSKCMSIKHSGDNLTGAGAGDDETVLIDLDQIPADVDVLLFIINIYKGQERKQNFGQVQNAFVRLYDRDSKTEVLRYDLTEDFSTETSVTVGRMYRHNGIWKFEAVGTGVSGGLNEYINMHK